MNATPIERAIAAAGSAAALGRICQQKPQAVTRWRRTGRVPAKHCPAVERATGVRCEELCSDVVWTRNSAGEVTGYHVRIAA